VWPSAITSLLLVGAGLITGWVNTLAGAGGLVAIPALLFSGLSAHDANGTLRVAIIAQCLVGTSSFHRGGKLPVKALATILPVVVAGGALGSLIVTRLPGHVLEPIVLGVLVVMALGLLVKSSWFVPKVKEEPQPMSAAAALGLFATGIYGGMVQAGVGLLLVAVLCGVMRFDLLRGNAIKLAAMLAFNAVSLTIFIAAGQVEWRHALFLSLGAMGGSWFAVRFALRRGQQSVRWVLIFAVMAAVVALILR
jgi:uncharacterized membrane protein YfcA